MGTGRDTSGPVTIRPGVPWERPTDAIADHVVAGPLTALRECVVAHPGALIRWQPNQDSDLARVLGLSAGRAPAGVEVAMDALRTDSGETALNMIVAGTAPHQMRRWSRRWPFEAPIGPARGVLIANGQFLDGLDVVPRGHPGDGRAEVHVYRIQTRALPGMRSRLASGTHLPHPDIATSSVRTIAVRASRAVPITIDGSAAPARNAITVEVIAGAYRLLL